MARLSRAVAPDFPHHVTQRGVRSLPIFRHDGDRQAYLRFLAEQSARFELDILAWCLMPNHVHLVVVPHDGESLARGIGEAHRIYTRHVNFSEDVRGHLFQERFHSCPMDEPHLLAAARYVEMNPVKAQLCRRAENWPWSSARFHLGLVSKDPLVKDGSLLGLVLPKRWAALLRQEGGAAEEELLRALRTGRPAGPVAFTKKIESLTGLRLIPGRPGRPRAAQPPVPSPKK